MKSKHFALWIPTIAACALALGVWMGYTIFRGSQRLAPSAAKQSTSATAPSRAASKLDLTLGLVERIYVEPINKDSIVEALMPRLMEQLDPHSTYISAKDMQAVNEPLEGEFDGIGVVFNMATDTVVVLNIIAGGPSYKAGVLPGDRIVTIDGDTVAGRKIEQNKVVERLRGKRGSKVTIGIERQNVEGLVDVTITRDKIPMKSIDAAFMIRPTVGYVRLTSFARTTHTEFVEAIDRLKEEGMQSLIFDLRGNSGGYLDQAILMTNEFLPEGKLMVYTEDRLGAQQKEFSTGGGRLTELPLVVLIDEYSASSSEIVAGALQDNDRGTIVGRRSFGKGLVQSQIPFNDGSAIRLTVAKYYTPTGRSIQKPFVRGAEGYNEDIWNRYESGQFFSADSIHFADSLKFTTPKGKTVYGGGGIMPDVFVPLDTLDMTPYYYAVTGFNILYRYTLDYADKHRKAINSIRTVEQLEAFLNGDKALLEDFVQYASEKGIKPNRAEITKSRVLIESLLRAYIARNTELQDNGYFSQIWPADPTLLKAFELLQE
ncbi:MAG: S41 family peptidase [Tidjanibacter sp.]|nr:S41 family peptidase [Tidjanibacter sp.]MBR7129104.1 S41 family peptidase [Tidjanibacter sp.]